MADFCAECLLLDLNDQKWGNEYFCPKKGKYVDPKNYACSNFVKRKQNTGYQRSGCYITTIICNILRQSDNCDLLETLRNFRDQYLKQNAEYLILLDEYDQIGPIISNELFEDENNVQIAKELAKIFLIPCYYAIKQKDYDNAITIYKNMVTALKVRYNLLDCQINYNRLTSFEELGKGRIRIK